MSLTGLSRLVSILVYSTWQRPCERTRLSVLGYLSDFSWIHGLFLYVICVVSIIVIGCLFCDIREVFNLCFRSEIDCDIRELDVSWGAGLHLDGSAGTSW